MTRFPTLVRHADTSRRGSVPVIYLHTLGDTLIKVGEKEIRPTSPMVFAALLYLAVERGRRVPRAALQEMLFPHADERSGAHSLRQLLYKLRQLGVPMEANGTFVLIGTEHVALDDVESFATSAQEDTPERIGFGFLPSYEPELSESFREWLGQARASANAKVSQSLAHMIRSRREALNWPAVDKYARLLLEVDPLNEEATLALAESAALTGSKAAALHMLEAFERETGRSDLRLQASLLRRRISERSTDAFQRTPSIPFVGREAEVFDLMRHVASARAGNPSFLVIAGEPGIGKSRLVAETIGLAALEGTSVHVVRCRPHYSSRPLSVFIDLIPPLRNCRGALGASPESLARLKLLTSHGEISADHPVDLRDTIARSEFLLAAVRDLIDAVASECPLLIAVEDAQWADPDSLREMRGLIQRISGRPLLLICTTRNLSVFRNACALDDNTEVRRLKPLAVEPMTRLASGLFPVAHRGEDTTAVARWCVRSAAGNPFFLQMLCSHYTRTGQAYEVPPDMASAIVRRLEQLPQHCRRLLEFSALLGRHATIDTLLSLSESTPLQLLDAVQQLEEDGYVLYADDAIRITHELLSDSIVGLLPPLSRRVLHSCVAAVLERRYDATNDAALLWDCAEQWSLSGETDKAIQFLRRCAQHAGQIGRAPQGVMLLQRAKALARYATDLTDITGELVLASKAAGRWEDAEKYSKELLAASPRQGTRRHTNLEMVGIEASWAQSLRAPEALEQLQSCLNAAEAPVDHRIDAARIIVRIAHELGDGQLATKAFEAVEPYLGESSVEYAPRLLPVIYHLCFGDRDKALCLARKLVVDLEHFDSLTHKFRVAMNSCITLGMLGAPDESLQLAAHCGQRAASYGMTVWEYDFTITACWTRLSIEEFEEAEKWHHVSERLSECTDGVLLKQRLVANRLELALWQKDMAVAQACYDAVAAVGFGDSMRGNAYLRGTELKLRQLDPSFQVDEAVLRDLKSLHHNTKRLTCADGLTAAIGEALRRRGRLEELGEFLGEYLSISRRERTEPPPSIMRLRQYRTLSAASKPEA